MMQNKFILGVTMILIIGGLSGCTELFGVSTGQVSGQDKAELVSYTIDSWTWMDEKVSDGFNHNDLVNYYKIQGNIKNIMDHTGNIQVTMKFYDKNDEYLGSESFQLKNVPESETVHFSKNIQKHVMRFSDYWNRIEHVTFSMKEF